MIQQSEISTDSATPHQVRSRQQGPIESMTQYRPNALLTPFKRDTHLCIMIEWWDSCPNPEKAAVAGGRPC
jgi:hypothetical protein